MTSISQSVLPPQAPNATQQSVPPANSPSASASGRAPPQAAGTASASASASAKTSYASATKKTFSPPPTSGTSTPSGAVGSSQHGKADVMSPVNGKIAIPPAVPAVGTPTIVNGNTPTSSTSGAGDHSRKPSVTISAAGASGYLPNGGPVAGKPKGGRDIQFGSAVPEGSAAAANTAPQPNNSANSLAVNTPLNPRVTSPQTSPSPIPQPPASGGRPPSSLHGNSASVSFGNFAGPEGNMRAPGTTQGPLAPGPQTNHLRRESSQSQHSDMSNHAMGPAAGRGGYPPQGGRGRGSFQGHYSQQQMQGSGHFPPNSRLPPNQPRAGQNMPPYQGQNRNLAPFPNSPHQSNRSPVPPNAQLAHPQPGQVPMASPQMGGQPYGYPYPYVGYPQNMGPPQGQYGMPQGYDQNFMAAQYNQFYMGNMPPSSPRPVQQMTPGPQQYHPGQYGTPQQPPSMSRESSSVSHTDRPGSSIGRPQAGSTTPAISTTGPPGRQANSPVPKPKSNFQLPQKKKAAPLKIINPDTGEPVTFDKQAASPAPPSKSQTPATTSTPTPPPRAPSHTDSQHSRTESKSVKTDEEKRNEMRDAIARKMEVDKAEEQRQKLEEESKASQDSKDAEEKILKEKEEADKQQREAAQAREMAEEALKKEKAEAEEAEKAAAKAKEEADEAAEKARKEQEQEDEFARMEAEFAEIERKEKEAEERYQQKKKAEKEEAARKEAEALKMEDEEMKRAEREAEEAEEARLKELEKPEGDDSQKERENMFAALKKDGSATPASDTQAAEESQVDSGVATPASDAPAAASQPSASVGKKRPADLKLDVTKPVEAAQPTPQLDSLRSARMIQRIEDISYPADIASPNPALNRTVPMGKFRYGKDFLLQFETKFTEKPSINWDARLKETVGDTTEPSSARTPARGSAGGSSIMGGRQASHRGPPSQPVMGSFAQGGRTLPPGTSSQQRFEASTAGRSAAPSRQTMTNPLANFVPNRTGGFPQPAGMSVKMDRTPSSTSLNHPNSPRNASQRGGSQRGSRAAAQREKPGDNSKMPLTAGANLKPIEVTASGWKPRSVGQNATGMAGPAPGGNGHMDPEQVQRKVKSNLNKMTPEKFEKISEQILEISAQSKDESDGRTLRQVIQLTFEKATDESHWAEMYAQFCKRMLESMSPEIKDENILDKKGEVVHGGALFRKYLLNRCQEEFEAGWKLNLGDKPEGETEEAVMLSDAYYKEAAAKRRGLGLVRFIGELYKLGMLTERIMHECVKKLVDYEGVPDESEVESLTSLLRTIGRPLDSTDKGTKFVDAYFTKINEMIVIEGLPSRLRFMLMDIVDLRKNGWQGKGSAVKGPTTLDAVREQAKQADREKEMQRQADNSRRGGGGGGRMPMGRGDARNFSGGGQFGNMMPPPDYQRNTVGMDDLRRLGSKGGSRQVSSQGQPTFAPSSMFGGPRGSNTRRPGMGAAPKDDSGASSRTGTPPAQKEKKEKEEREAAKSANTFSALAGLESSEAAETASPSTSPPVAKSQPVERQRSKSPKSKDSAEGDGSKAESS